MSDLTIKEIEYLREKMESPGLRLATVSGLCGEITNSQAMINSLLDMAEDSIGLRWTFKLQQSRMGPIIKMWREEDPENRDLMIPDLGDMLEWCMEKMK